MAQIITPSPIITTDQVRAERCLKEIEGTLRAHNCQLVPVTTIAGGQIVRSECRVVPLPNVPGDLKGAG